MEIRFKKSSLRKICNDRKTAVREWGERNANELSLRLAEIEAFENLNDLFSLPQARLHELTGDLKGIFSVDLEHPYRLLFRPDNDPLPLREDGKLDLSLVTEILILGKEDTHGSSGKKRIRAKL